MTLFPVSKTSTTHSINYFPLGVAIGYYTPDPKNKRHHAFYERLKRLTCDLQESEVDEILMNSSKDTSGKQDGNKLESYRIRARALQKMAVGFRILYTSEAKTYRQIFNTVMAPLFEEYAKKDVVSTSALPTPVLWFVRHFRQDLLEEIAKTQSRKQPNIKEFVDKELSRRGVDLKSSEGKGGYKYMVSYLEKRSRIYEALSKGGRS